MKDSKSKGSKVISSNYTKKWEPIPNGIIIKKADIKPPPPPPPPSQIKKTTETK